MRSGLEKFDGGNGGNFFGNDSHLDVCLDAALIDEIDYSFDYNNCNSMLLGEMLREQPVKISNHMRILTSSRHFK